VVTSALHLREARKRAGLTQRQLAERLEVAQPRIARWESGRAAPSLERVKSVLAICGLDLIVSLAPRDEETRRMLTIQATRTPDELIDQIAGFAGVTGQTATHNLE
jgi:transcriptional regulator with XRE-family HTH domain